MPHEIHLISTIAAAFGFAMILGLLAARLRLPPLVGYLLAGIFIGPFTPGFVGDIGLASQLAEIGVMLLMFGVGLHFSLADLMKVKSIAIPGAVVQILVAVGLGAMAATAWGWSGSTAIVFGLCLSVASTVVLLPRLLWWIAQTGSQELFRLGVIAVAIGVAFGAAKLFDVSFALGAFFAGMMLRESDLSHRAAEESLPLRDAFAVLFFVSVGMLFDPAVVWQHPFKLLIVVLVIVLGKTIAAVALVMLFGYPLTTAFTVAAGLAQIGEFSFILAGLSLSLGLISKEAQDLILAGALVSIALNSALFTLIEPIRLLILDKSALARKLEHRADSLNELPGSTDRSLLEGQVVLVGYGRVGRRLGQALRARGMAMVVIDQNKTIIEALRGDGIPAVLGDGSSPEALIQAHIAHASMLVLAVDDPVVTQRTASLAREFKPNLAIVIRAHSQDEADHYHEVGLGIALVPEIALAEQMATKVFENYSTRQEQSAVRLGP